MSNIEVYESVLQRPLVQQAIKLARHHHHGQKYGGKDFVDAHLLTVLKTLVVDFGIVDEATCLATILHDILEDTGCQVQEIYDVFGLEVLEIVRYMTRYSKDDYDAYILKLVNNVSAFGKKARDVKRADSTVNMKQCIREGNVKLCQRYLKVLEILGEK